LTNLSAGALASGTVPAARLSGSYTINASTASALQTSRTINGTGFNGTANITTALWGTARTFTIGSTGKSVNGAADVSWTLAEIGAAAASHTHPWAEVTGAPATATRWPTWGEVTGKPTTFVPSTHSHDWSQIVAAPDTATRWPTYAEVSDKPLTTDSRTNSSTVTLLNAKAMNDHRTSGDHDSRYLGRHSYRAIVRQGSWSRIGRTVVNSLGGVYLVSLNHTRTSVVVNTAFMVTCNHSNSRRLMQLQSGNYTQVQVRLTDIDANNCFVEVLDSAVGAGDHEYTVTIALISAGGFTPITTYTAGGGTVRATLQTVFGDVVGSGAGLTDLNASNLSTGTVANARLPTTATRWPTWSEVTSKPSTFAPAAHTHAGDQVTVLGNHLSVASDGKISVNNTGTRQAGMYGIYNSTLIGHIWSMGTAYAIAASGADFGNLYGLAYKHTNNATGGTMAGGHMMVWCANGVGRAAMGDNIWTSGNVTAYSDVRVKTNIEVIPDALEKVSKLSGYTFDRTDTGMRQTGVIAQEVLEVIPEAVTGGPTEADPEGHYSVAYGNMVGLLIEAIKELKSEIEELKEKLNGTT
jgi:hypothetical protein